MRRIERAAVAVVAALGGLAALAHFDHWATLAAFVIATVALAGMAWIVSFSTEQVGERLGPAATGLLQATLGNLPELFVVIFALRAGERAVAQSAIVGSLFATAMLVLGLTILVGAAAGPGAVMHFRANVARDAATLLMVCAFIIVIVSFAASSGVTAGHVKTISAVAVCLLAAAGVGAGLVSDWFVDSLAPAIHQLHISQAFAGLVIVAIASNAVEHVVGIVLAARRQSDLAISVVVNSVAQIAAFLFPALVLISLTMHTSLTFSLRPVYIGALAVTAIVIWLITEDGEGHPYEGWALVVTYVVLAMISFYE